MQVKFPSNFLWGASLSSYQSEGGNLNTDWYLWEKERGLEGCQLTCDHYHLFDKDFQLASQLNLNSLRFSIEWARVCPYEEVFSQKEIEHYSSVFDSLLKYQLKPVVTLHHFTNPAWFADRGGWLKSSNIDYFLKFLRKIVEVNKDKVDTWLIFNEPLVYIYQGFITGCWPPGRRSYKDAKKVLANILEAYCTGYEEIKRIYDKDPVSVSLAKSMRAFSSCPDSLPLLSKFTVFLRDRHFNWQVLNYLAKRKKLDFIGLNYYCKDYAKVKGVFGDECKHTHHSERRNYLGWYIWPEGLYKILLSLKKLDLPIVITENGTAESRDEFYQLYLVQHLEMVAKAITKGVKIEGYFWWSLLDNFEWDKGFGPRFGLFEVDYKSLERIPRDVSSVYAKIVSENKIEI
ncbi:MAG: family 1 glycosylhydrolase [Candidatus Omnitrophica bacterium]|nr:family 1 glycosylhydrolase [Candidatus Omnitrophota bacterium]